MIDDDEISFHRLAPCGQHKAFPVMRAVLAKAVIARRGHRAPNRRMLRNINALAFIAGLADLGKTDNTTGIRGIGARKKAAIGQRTFKVIVADVIGAPLEQGDAYRRAQRLAHDRNILGEKLILEVLGAGRDDHFAARAHRRHQVGKGLARPRARFGDQYRIGSNRRGDALGHIELLRTQAVARDMPRQQAVRRKDFGQRNTHRKPGK